MADETRREDGSEGRVPRATEPGHAGLGSTGRAWLSALAVVGLVVGGTVVFNRTQGDGQQVASTATEEAPDFASRPDTLDDELLALGMRYRPSGESEHKEQWTILQKGDVADDPGPDWRFAAGVIEVAQALSEPEGMGTSSLEGALELASASADSDERQEFVDLVQTLQTAPDSQPIEIDHKVGMRVSYTPDEILENATDAAGGGIENESLEGPSTGDFFELLAQGLSQSTEDAPEPGSTTGSEAMRQASPVGGVAESETYAHIEEPGFLSTSTNPFSTVSADVDTASYANFRRQVRRGFSPEGIYDDSIRVEEWLNYFDYDYAKPDEGELFGVTSHIGKCPWNDGTQLLTLGFATDAEAARPKGGRNIVFLIDVSGSMDYDNKLPLLKESMLKLVDRLGEDDTLSLVTYASNGKVVFSGLKGTDSATIKTAISGLYADGATNGGEGLQKAYDCAKENFVQGGVNRIILCSDGDMNLGLSTTGELINLVSEKKKEGVYLSVLGFGDGNYHDQNMEAIADNGNGNYHYIDCPAEADKVLNEELESTMTPVADDVKIQIEFNPANVKAYRLIGYVDRTLQTGDFRDDAKDGGEVGAGQAFTVAYEIIPADSDQKVDEVERRYGNGQESDVAKGITDELARTTCRIGGKDYAEFSPDRLSYEVTFGQGETIPAAPELRDLPDGWSVISSKSSTAPDGTISNVVTVGKDGATREYAFKYVVATTKAVGD